MSEEWRPVPAHPAYDVSDLGRVRSWKHRGRGCQDKGRTESPHDLTASDPGKGYRYVTLDGHPRPVHHLVLEAFVGPRPTPKHESRHLDDDPGNNWAGNLAWGTHAENMQDRVRAGHHNNSTRTTCRPGGHLLQAPNLHPSYLPKRKCQACHTASLLAGYYKRKGCPLTRAAQRAHADKVYERLMAVPAGLPSSP